MASGNHAAEHAKNYGEHLRGEHQQQRRRHSLENDREHALAVAERISEVASGRLQQVAPELFVGGLVQSVLRSLFGEVLL